jgi:hypothetical protein
MKKPRPFNRSRRTLQKMKQRKCKAKVLTKRACKGQALPGTRFCTVHKEQANSPAITSDTTTQRSRFSRIISPSNVFWGWIGIASSILGIPLLSVSLLPQVKFQRDTSLNSKDAFSTVFRIANDSLWSIYDVRLNLKVVSATTTEGSQLSNVSVMDSVTPIAKTIHSGRAASTQLPLRLGIDLKFTTYTKAVIEAQISYTSGFLHRRVKEKTHTFESTTDADGVVHWFDRADE